MYVCVCVPCIISVSVFTLWRMEWVKLCPHVNDREPTYVCVVSACVLTVCVVAYCKSLNKLWQVTESCVIKKKCVTLEEAHIYVLN